MKIIAFILLVCASLVLRAQTKNDIQILILDGDNTSSLITEGGIYLVIVGNNYGNGPVHEFKNGILYLHDVPTGYNVKFRIQSKVYIFREGEKNVNAGNSYNNSNAISLYLYKVASSDLVIRGKVVDKTEKSRGIPDCQVEINIEKVNTAYSLVTDSLGYFFKEIKDGIKFYPSNFTISIHKPGYSDENFHFFIAKDSINTLKDLELEKKPALHSHIKVLGPVPIIKTLSVSAKNIKTENKGQGIIEIESNPDELPQNINLRLACQFCQYTNWVISKQALLDSTPLIDLRKLVGYKGPIFSFMIGSNGMIFPGENFKTKFAMLPRIGVETYFSLNRHYVGLGAGFNWPAMEVTTRTNYTTLPGLKNIIYSKISLSGYEFWLSYFFSNPSMAKLVVYSSVLAGVFTQAFKNNQNDSLLQEPLDDYKHWYGGGKIGLRYNLSSHFTIGAFAQALYLPLTFTNYQFNYFGRADVAKNQAASIVPGFGLFVLINVLNTTYERQ